MPMPGESKFQSISKTLPGGMLALSPQNYPSSMTLNRLFKGMCQLQKALGISGLSAGARGGAGGMAAAPSARESTAVFLRTRTALSRAQRPSQQMGSRGEGVIHSHF